MTLAENIIGRRRGWVRYKKREREREEKITPSGVRLPREATWNKTFKSFGGGRGGKEKQCNKLGESYSVGAGRTSNELRTLMTEAGKSISLPLRRRSVVSRRRERKN